MKFVKQIKVIAALCLLNAGALLAQEAPPNVDGLFEDDVEPGEDFQQFDPDQNFVPPSPTVNTPSSSSSSNSKIQRLPELKGDIPNPNEKMRMDFIQVEIEEVVKYFAERIRKKFIYDPSVLSGKITIISPVEVTVQEAWKAFLSAMEIRGLVVYPNGAYFEIKKVAEGRKSPVPLHTTTIPNDDSYVTRIVTLRFLSVQDIRQAVRDLLSRSGGDVIEHAPTNTLIISDYASNIRRIVKILNMLDIEGFQEQIEVVPLKHASSTDIARQVNEFFNTSARGRSRPAAGGSKQQETIQKVVADDRTNSLIILGSERGIEQVKQFIKRIDVPVDGGGGLIHVYPLQNVKATDISTTLASLASGQSGKKSKAANSLTNLEGGPLPSSVSNSADLLNGEVKITADEATNALVIQASPRDFEVLKGIIQKLDIRRRQVFIESAILEASTDNGFNWRTQASGPFGQTNAMARVNEGDTTKSKSGIVGNIGSLSDSLDSLLLNPAKLTGVALGFRSGGTYKITTSDGTEQELPFLSAIIQVAQNDGRLNVLSTPHILATANEEATISIGEEIPQLASSTQNTVGQPTQSFTRLKVATELSIKPQINAGDYITLEVKQKIDEPKGDSSGGLGLTTINREAKTTVIVRDGQTIVIGGLMRNRETSSTNKVPLLGDIPILGWLFKSTTKTKAKVNLLLFITPNIIRDTDDMNDIFFKKLKQRQEFLKEIGSKENTGLNISGITKDQLKMLDEDYIKSLVLEPVPTIPNKEDKAPLLPNGEKDIPAPASFDGLTKPAPSAPMSPNVRDLDPVEPLPLPMDEPVPTPGSMEPQPLPEPVDGNLPPTPKDNNVVPSEPLPLELEDSPPDDTGMIIRDPKHT